MQDDDGDLRRLMQRFGRTDLGAHDADESDVEQYVDGASLTIHIFTLPCRTVSCTERCQHVMKPPRRQVTGCMFISEVQRISCDDFRHWCRRLTSASIGEGGEITQQQVPAILTCVASSASPPVLGCSAGLDVAILGAAAGDSSDDSEDDSSEDDSSDAGAQHGEGADSGDSDSDAEMDTLLLRDERRMQGDGAASSSASSSSDEGGFSAPRRGCADC